MKLEDSIVVFLIVVIFTAIIFLLCRELNCWYLKINEHLRIEKEMLDTLKSIESKLDSKD